MEHFGRFDSLIEYWATAQGQDWRLIKAIVRQESEFDPVAVSGCGACGLMQLMPGTADEMGVSHGKIFDPDSNLRAGIGYYKKMYKCYPEIADPVERIKFALAAYNAGRGNVNKAIVVARGYGMDWQRWDNVASVLDKVTGEKSKETINYVAKITGYYKDYCNG